jgi:SET and MYND domain-containing protein
MATVVQGGSHIAPSQEGLLLQRAAAGPGAPLLADEPSAVSALDITSQCSTCLRAPQAGETLQACTGCRLAKYCGRACQKADWRTAHRKECASLKKVRMTKGREKGEREMAYLLREKEKEIGR